MTVTPVFPILVFAWYLCNGFPCSVPLTAPRLYLIVVVEVQSIVNMYAWLVALCDSLYGRAGTRGYQILMIPADEGDFASGSCSHNAFG